MATFGGTCRDVSALWRAGMQKLPGRLPYVTVEDLAWALTQEWALSNCAAKTSTWVLTQEWALARDTMVYIIIIILLLCSK